MPKYFNDQMHREIAVSFPPVRIVSLVPSQTELLYDLGLGDQVVGQTLFCVHPEEAHRTKPRVGGTKKLDLDRIRALKPDLIIGNKEENQKEQIEELEKEFPVWMSDIKNLGDALDMIRMLGRVTETPAEAEAIASQIESGFQSLTMPVHQTAAAYLIWRDPYMLAGSDTFISEMMRYCGLSNVCGSGSERYPQANAERLVALNPAVVLLSSEPYPFKEKHLEELKALLPESAIKLVDGELFSWYGSRLLRSPAYFRSLMDILTRSVSNRNGS